MVVYVCDIAMSHCVVAVSLVPASNVSTYLLSCRVLSSLIRVVSYLVNKIRPYGVLYQRFWVGHSGSQNNNNNTILYYRGDYRSRGRYDNLWSVMRPNRPIAQ